MVRTRRPVLAIVLALLAAFGAAPPLARADLGGGTTASPTSESECEALAPGFECANGDALGLGQVQLFSGEYDLQVVDMRIPGRGFDFVMKRRYLSRGHDVGPDISRCVDGGAHHMARVTSALGMGWDFSYNVTLKSEQALVWIEGCVDENGLTCRAATYGRRIFDGNGRSDFYVRSRVHVEEGDPQNPPGDYTGWAYRSSGRFEALVPDPRAHIGDKAGYTLHFQNGGSWHFREYHRRPMFGAASVADEDFDSYAVLDRITDRLGNTMELLYSDQDEEEALESPRLEMVIDTLGRPILFEYEQDWTLAAVRDFSGRVVRYDHDTTTGELTRVVPATDARLVQAPDADPAGTRRYAYAGGSWHRPYLSKLTAVLDERGRVLLENTYSTGTTPERSAPFAADVYCADCADHTTTQMLPQLDYDRIVGQVIAGRPMSYGYTWVHEPSATRPCAREVRTTVVDVEGNVSVTDFSSDNLIRRRREYTGRSNPAQPVVVLPQPPGYYGDEIFFAPNGNAPVNPLRPGEGEDDGMGHRSFETTYQYRSDGLLSKETHPRGNSEQFYYSMHTANLPRDCPNLPTWQSEGGLCSNPDVGTLPWASCHAGKPRLVVRRPGAIGAAQTCIDEVTAYDTDWQDAPPGHYPNRGTFSLVTFERRGHQTYSHSRDARGLRIATRESGAASSHEYEFDNGDPAGPGQLTAHVWPADADGRRQRDEYTYYDGSECASTPPPGAADACAMRGYLKSSTIDAHGFALTTYYRHDARGNVTATISPSGNGRFVDFDAHDNPIRETSVVTLPSGRQVDYVTLRKFDGRRHLVRSDVANLDENGDPVGDNPWLTSVDVYDALGHRIASFAEIEAVDESVWAALELKGSHEEVDAYLAAELSTSTPLNVARWYFDGNGNVVRAESPLVFAARVPDDSNAVETKQFDERGKLHRTITAPDDPALRSTSQFDYDANGNLSRIVAGFDEPAIPGDPHSGPRVTTLEHDGFDRLVRQTDAMGNVSIFHHDERDAVVRTELLGQLADDLQPSSNRCLSVITSTFDLGGRPRGSHVRVFDPAEMAAGGTCPVDAPDSGGTWASTITTLDDRGRVVRVTDPIGRESQAKYDSAGRASSTKDPAGNQTTQQYDVDSFVRSVELAEPDGHGGSIVTRTTFDVDALGRVTKTTDPGGHETQRFHDSRGLVTRSIDARGNVAHAQHDGLGRQVRSEIELRSGGVGSGALLDSIITTTEYDAGSRVVSQTDGRGNTTSYEMDALGHPLFTRFADGTESRSVFDRHGNRVRSIDPNGTIIDYRYDRLNRLVERRFLATPYGVARPWESELRAYDGAGNLVLSSPRRQGATFAPGQVARHHDSRGLPLSEGQQVDLLQIPRTLTFTWDLAGQRVGVTHPALGLSPARTISRRIDDLGRTVDLYDGALLPGTCEGVTAPPSCVLHQSFEGRRLSRRVLGNGVETAYQRDSERLVNGIFHGLPGQTAFLALSFGRNETHDKVWSFDVSDHAIDRSFELDSAHRLTRSTESTGVVVQYALDAAGNREHVLGGSAPGAYSMTGDDDDLNQYTQTPIDSRQYLPDGSLTSSGSATGATNFSWTPLGELNVLHRETGNGAVRLEYMYDGLGRRIEKLVKRGGVPIETVRYYHDGDRVIAESSDLRGVRRLVPGDRGLDEVVQVKDLSATYWLHADDQLSVMAVTDATGAVIERYEFGDYGERTILDGSGTLTRAASVLDLEIGFSGGRLDDESGLYHLRARYLDPKVGRFISRDPLGMWGDAVSFGNGSLYAGANPWTWSDPSGLYAMGGGDGAMWNPSFGSRWDPRHREARPCYQEAVGEGETNGPTDSESAEKPDSGADSTGGSYLDEALGGAVSSGVEDILRTNAVFLRLGAWASGGDAPAEAGNIEAAADQIHAAVEDHVEGLAASGRDDLAHAVIFGVALGIVANVAVPGPGEGGTLVGKGAGLRAFHGTDIASARSLLGGAPLDAATAAARKIDGPPGFFLATSASDAEYFALRRQPGGMVQLDFTATAVRDLEAAGATMGPIPSGKTIRFAGTEFVIPPAAFATFEGLRAAGQIAISGW